MLNTSKRSLDNYMITWMGTEYGSLDEFSKAFTDAGNEYKGV